MLSIVQAKTPEQLNQVRYLLRNYGQLRNSLNEVALPEPQKELDFLPGQYMMPDGCLLLALYDNQPAGCVALRKRKDETCELRRLFVEERFRGMRVAKALVNELLKFAMHTGYQIIRLDTDPWMKPAQALYRTFGFVEVEAYRYNPIKGVRFYELDLTRFSQTGRA